MDSGKELETFTCFVDCVRDGIAYIRMTTPQDEEFNGSIGYEVLLKHNIVEHQRFYLTTIERENGDVGMRYTPIPFVEVTKEQISEIDKKINSLTKDGFFLEWN